MKNFNLMKNITRRLGQMLVLLSAVALAGCQSENPLDYLPKSSGGYMAMNAVEFRESAGLRRLTDEMSRYQAGAQFESDKAERMILAFDTPTNTGAVPPVYGVMTGRPGFADELVQQYKNAGALEGKKSGRTTYTSGSQSIAPVGDAGVLIFQTDAALARMINVGKKKEEGARTSAVFTFVNAQSSNHALVAASVAQPLVELAGPALAMVERTDPNAAAALRQVSMVSMTFDWDEHPVAEIMLHLADKAGSDSLAALINQYLGLAKMMPMLSQEPAVKQVVDPIRAIAAEDGVRLRVDVPANVADQLFDSLPQTLPQQPTPQY